MGTTTTNFDLYKPTNDEEGWDDEVNGSLDTIDTEIAARQETSEKGSPNGYAELDGGGIVPDAQLPAPPGTDAHAASAVSFDPSGLTYATGDDVQTALEQLDAASSGGGGGGGGAPTDATYLTTTAHSGLSSEVVVGATPGGELSGTWTAITVDDTHAGTTHHAAVDTHMADASDAHDASAISVADSGNNFAATTVEAALAELADATTTLVFSHGGPILSPAGALDVVVWRAPFACTVTNVRGFRVGGTGATINARKNASSAHLSSNLSLSSASTWMDGGAVQNTSYSAGDYLEVRLVTITGTPTNVVIQVDFTRSL